MRTLLLLGVLALAANASAKEVHGIKLDDSITVDGKALKLNGAGTRTKMMFKVYVAGLYLESTTDNADKAIGLTELKRVEMVMMRNLGKNKIIDAVHDGIAKNARGDKAALAAPQAQFDGALEDLKEGEHLSITFHPAGPARVVVVAHGKETTIQGKEFAEALLSVWLGASPVDAGLKQSMLGK